MSKSEFNHVRRLDMELVQIIKALSDETRLRILNLLRFGELCVCDIESTLGVTQSNASRHLEKLRNVKLISYEKRSQWVYYRIDENLLNNHPFINELIYKELDEVQQCQIDIENLRKYKETGCNC
jgi:ArsR family transcriptional regulator, arsenate/arsenite/antimonite-responsive transcriptional repressor